METIHICLGLHDATGSYSKYTATAMVSVLMNTSSNVVFHIIHDDTLSQENQEKLSETVKKHSGEIEYHNIDLDERQYEGIDLRRFTIGTLFRLMICKELQNETTKVIYLDSDVVVDLDINDLWHEDLDGYPIGGCVLEMSGNWPLIDRGIIDRSSYFNAGVLLMDIESINQRHDLWDECTGFLLKHPELCRGIDQDAINYVFRGEIKKLDGKYNSKSYQSRAKATEDRRIYHFAGDCPRDVYDYVPDRLFYRAFRMTPWGTEEGIVKHYEKRIKEKDSQKQIVYDLMKQVYEHPEKKKIFWGVGGAIHEGIMERIPWEDGDYYVDSKASLWNQPHRCGMVYSPQKLQYEDPKNTIVIVTIFRFNEVKPLLEKMGFVENENFFNGKYLLAESETMFCQGERDCKWDL